MTAFERGYQAFASIAGVNQSAFGGADYVNNVENAIDALEQSLNRFRATK